MKLRFVLAPATGGEGGIGAGNVDGNGTPPPAAPPGGSWYSSFASSDNKGFAEQKGFKTAEDVVDSYRNLEKLMGVPKERLVKLPDKEDAPEWNDIYGRMGRPEKSDGYEVAIPEGGSEEFGKWAKDLFHGLGLSKKQGDTIAAKWNERAKEAFQHDSDQTKIKTDDQVKALQTEWGAAYKEKVKANSTFLEAIGIDDKSYDKLRQAMGVDGAEKMIDSIITKFGIKIGEHEFKGGTGGRNDFGGALSPSAAKSKLDGLMSDPEYVKRYLNNESKEKEEVRKLHEWMAASGD